MILPYQTIVQELGETGRIKPFFADKQIAHGMSYGCSCAGYDVRIAQDVVIDPGGFKLASIMEEMDLPNDILATVTDKSTWARRGLAVQNTVIEPGWKGFLTIELANHGREVLRIEAGTPIAQILFHRLESPTIRPYSGKYQNQPDRPVDAIMEGDIAL